MGRAECAWGRQTGPQKPTEDTGQLASAGGGGGAEGFGAQIWLGLEGVWLTRERGLGASEMFAASFPRPTHHHPLSQFKITVGLWLLAAWAVVSSTISLMSSPAPGMEEERSCWVNGKSER